MCCTRAPRFIKIRRFIRRISRYGNPMRIPLGRTWRNMRRRICCNRGRDKMRKSWQKVAVRLACVLGVSCLALTEMPAKVWAAAAPGTYILNRSAVVLPVGSAFLSTSTGVVEISVSHLVNHALNGRSGDLRLLVYLTKTRYTGEGSIRGSVIAQKDF